MKTTMQLFSYNRDTSNYELVRIEDFESDSENGLFEQIERANNRCRYSMSEWRFTDSNMKNKFNTWYKSLNNSKKMDLYYGNGVVD